MISYKYSGNAGKVVLLYFLPHTYLIDILFDGV